MRINHLILSCCGVGLAGACQANAILIDHFNAPLGGQTVTLNGAVAGATANNTALGLAGVLGGSRYLEADVQTVFGGGNSTVASANNPATALDNYNLATDVSVNSLGKVRWDANGAGLNANLPSGGSFELFDVSNDLPTSFTIQVSTFGGGTSSSTVLTGAGSFDVNLFFPTAGFVGGANWSDIDRITLIVDTPRSGDARINAVEFNIPNVADTGSSMILLGAGFIGLATLRRQRSVM
jgi:hypothetical protein